MASSLAVPVGRFVAKKGSFAHQAKASTCSKSTYKTERLNTERAEEQPILG